MNIVITMNGKKCKWTMMDDDVVNLPVSRKESDASLHTKLQSSQKYTV